MNQKAMSFPNKVAGRKRLLRKNVDVEYTPRGAKSIITKTYLLVGPRKALR